MSMTTNRSGLIGKEGDDDESRVYAGTEQDREDLRVLVIIAASGSQVLKMFKAMSAVRSVGNEESLHYR